MSDIVQYWRATELFSPPAIPKVPDPDDAAARRRECVYDVPVEPGAALPMLPWDAQHPHQLEPIDTARFAWRHTVYGGVFALDRIRQALVAEFGGDAPDHGGTRPTDDAAMFAFTVNDRGVLLGNTTAFSSCAWAIGRIRDPGLGVPGWLDGFDEAAEECAEAIRILTGRDIVYEPDAPPVPTATTPDGRPPSAWQTLIATSQAGAAARQASGTDWKTLLGEILGGAAVGAIGALIGDMGAGIVAGAVAPVVRRAVERRDAGDSGDAAAGGRAPRPAVSSAQPAPSAEASAAEPGNGPDEVPEEPPGRPVLLPDVVAVAAHVAAVCGVSDLLGSTHRIRVVSRQVWLDKDGSPPDPAPVFLNSLLPDDLRRVAEHPGEYGPALAAYLTDGASVAAADRVDMRTNPEVLIETLSPERFPEGRWPARSDRPLAASQQFAVNAAWGELADAGLFSVNGPPGTGKTTMLRDLIAAVVVERAQSMAELEYPHSGFRGVESWTTDEGVVRKFRPVADTLAGFEIVVASSNNGAVENITKELPGLGALDDEWHGEASYFVDQAVSMLGGLPAWGIVAAPLGNAKKRKAFKETFWWGSSADDDVPSRPRGAGPDAEPDDPEPLGMHELLRQLADNAGLYDPPVAERYPAAGPPGLRPVADDAEDLAIKWSDAVDAFEDACSAETVHRLRRTAAAAAWEACRDPLGGTATRANLMRLDQARRRWPEHVPPDEWAVLPESERELLAPWSDPEWAAARTRVFLAALDLHQCFVAANAATIRRNLNVLMGLLGGRGDGTPGEAALAAWRTLFLLVPVVSTTFASCGRLFRDLGAESLGWVLVDEAGQSTPQAAVGALWRARRAVLVGDPLQLEPVVQLPQTVQNLLRSVYGVGAEWMPSVTSAQRVADRTNQWGTSLTDRGPHGEDSEVWVGAPLRVHRRCENPMFDVCNDLAYEGLMVYGTAEAAFPSPQRRFPNSSWVDVSAGQAHGKWIPREGAALADVLAKLHKPRDHVATGYGVDLARIRVLSPFRDVVDGARQVVRDLRWEGEPPEGMDRLAYAAQVRAFVRDNIGTVHTMQGKEADVVVLVLGTHPDADAPARAWAAAKPNLLNVAVSRARRRLIVIGDRSLWARERYFGDLARQTAFPVYAWPRQRSAVDGGLSAPRP
ncbi:DEAD/DEAH box helicase [Yinghuangia seranimata]|uniref:DEAD/DEAH box helicase n=1 Tax=Yinghuangia seranimata TaxID=408067 RepID=UPI00248C39CA|nr:AAA domain-containing protein [Yinghuangia seranimata]MDI2127053.1 AAA domain-containing protein [Yinghuangia seranimata]